jgi:hypothetical protein
MFSTDVGVQSLITIPGKGVYSSKNLIYAYKEIAPIGNTQFTKVSSAYITDTKLVTTFGSSKLYAVLDLEGPKIKINLQGLSGNINVQIKVFDIASSGHKHT